jgi:hypothetical protein
MCLLRSISRFCFYYERLFASKAWQLRRRQFPDKDQPQKIFSGCPTVSVGEKVEHLEHLKPAISPVNDWGHSISGAHEKERGGTPHWLLPVYCKEPAVFGCPRGTWQHSKIAEPARSGAGINRGKKPYRSHF